MHKSPASAPLLAALLAATLLSAPATAACRLALALGLDVSRSVSDPAYERQVQAVQMALADAEVRAALLISDAPVALAIYEWSGRWQQQVIVGWTMLETESDIDTVIASMDGIERSFRGVTAVGRALFFGGRLLLAAPECAARTLDLSGDGRNNDGPEAASIYARFDFGDITVNGLAIGGLESDILDYYRSEVMRGPGAFVEYANDWRMFPDVFRRKLLREITAAMFSGLRAPVQRLQ